MTTSLIPERPLLISPTLAATIGLEEAVMLHVISELLLQTPAVYRQQRRWGQVTQDTLAKVLPFWKDMDIRRVLRNLQELGLLLVEVDRDGAGALLLAINQPDPASPPAPSVPRAAPSPFQNSAGAATCIPPNWQPDDNLYRQCEQRNIPRDYVEQELPSFVRYYRERQKTQYSWHHTFLNWVVAGWEKQRGTQNARELECTMSPDWQPDTEAMDILEHAGINRGFIEDAVPEFILYWRERGVASSTWNVKFIAHVRRQWERYVHAVENDTTPRPIDPAFQPSPGCYDVLAMANIDPDFARAQIKEFVLYWQDRNEVQESWNRKFLQHVKYQWARQMQPSRGAPLLDKLRDRSWAD